MIEQPRVIKVVAGEVLARNQFGGVARGQLFLLLHGFFEQLRVKRQLLVLKLLKLPRRVARSFFVKHGRRACVCRSSPRRRLRDPTRLREAVKRCERESEDKERENDQLSHTKIFHKSINADALKAFRTKIVDERRGVTRHDLL